MLEGLLILLHVLVTPIPVEDPVEEFQIPSIYAALWFEVENCIDRRGDLRQVRFYRVITPDADRFGCGNGQKCFAIYRPLERAIYIDDTYLLSFELVRHEMLHALGAIGHPEPLFSVCTGAGLGWQGRTPRLFNDY